MSKEKYSALTALTNDIKRGSLYTGNCKFAIIHDIIKTAVHTPSTKPVLSKFDRIATSRIWGKPLAIGIMLLSFVFSMLLAIPLMGVGMAIPSLISQPLYSNTLFL